MKTIRLALCSLPLMLAAFAVPAISAAETGPTSATSAVQVESTAADASAELGGAADDARGDVTDADDASLMSTAARSDRPNAPGVKLCCGTAGDYGVICWRC